MIIIFDLPIPDCFVIMHPKKYEWEAPPLHPPAVLGSFSVDSEKNIHYDKSMMSVLSPRYTPDGDSMKVRQYGCDGIFWVVNCGTTYKITLSSIQ